jgi:hypothetical protein
MLRLKFHILILILLAACSCTSRKVKIDTDNLIPEKDLVAILTDFHLADGLLTLPKYHSLFLSLDSISAYIQVIEKHGYTKEAMDKTIRYYFLNKPKQLIKINDQVLGILSEMESLEEKQATIDANRINNLWKGNDIYFLPDNNDSDSTLFSITINNPGIYTLSYTATLFPDDQSVNPRITAWLCNSDSVNNGKKHYIKTTKYIKDGLPHNYILILNVPEKAIVRFRGLLYDFDNLPDDREKHLFIDKITLTYSSVPAI